MGFTFPYTSSFAFHKEAYFENSRYEYNTNLVGANMLVTGSVYNSAIDYKQSKTPVGQFNFTFQYVDSTKAGSIAEQSEAALKTLIEKKPSKGILSTGSVEELLQQNPDYNQGDSAVDNFRRRF